jgi:sulfite exporter TauE/SafE
MNSALLISLALGLLPGFLIFTLVYTVTVKVLERQLTFTQSLMISALASAISIVLLAVYYLAKAPLEITNRDFDKLATLIVWFVLGTVITRLARNYGIKKHGWFGLGGRANLWLLGISWVVIVVVLGIQYLMGR